MRGGVQPGSGFPPLRYGNDRKELVADSHKVENGSREAEMATRETKDLLTRLADAGEEAIHRLGEVPGAERLVGTLNSMRDRVDEMQKRLRGLDAIERRVTALERRLDKLDGGKKPATARKASTAAKRGTTRAKKSTSTARTATARKKTS